MQERNLTRQAMTPVQRTPVQRTPVHTTAVPALTVQLSADQTSAEIRNAQGQGLELPIGVWTEVLARIELALAEAEQAAQVGSPRAPADFGPAPGRVGPGRHGANWSAHELAQLGKAFHGGQSVAALALAHQRTTGAVEGQLCRLGLIRLRERQFGGPWTEPEQPGRYRERQT